MRYNIAYATVAPLALTSSITLPSAGVMRERLMQIALGKGYTDYLYPILLKLAGHEMSPSGVVLELTLAKIDWIAHSPKDLVSEMSFDLLATRFLRAMIDDEAGALQAQAFYLVNKPLDKKSFQRLTPEDLDALQYRVDLLVDQLHDMDFANLAALINWLEAVDVCTSHMHYMTPPWMLIVDVFAQHGFKPIAYDPTAQDEVGAARYIIGEALWSLNKKDDHSLGLFSQRAKIWREKFGHDVPK